MPLPPTSSLCAVKPLLVLAEATPCLDNGLCSVLFIIRSKEPFCGQPTLAVLRGEIEVESAEREYRERRSQEPPWLILPARELAYTGELDRDPRLRVFQTPDAALSLSLCSSFPPFLVTPHPDIPVSKFWTFRCTLSHGLKLDPLRVTFLDAIWIFFSLPVA